MNMNLDDLILEGEQFRNQVVEGDFGDYIRGEDYEKWIAKSVIFMEKKYNDLTMTKRFIAASESAVGSSPSYLDTMLGILKAFQETEEELLK